VRTAPPLGLNLRVENDGFKKKGLAQRLLPHSFSLPLKPNHFPVVQPDDECERRSCDGRVVDPANGGPIATGPREDS
jgi:hypothetical protein